MTYEKWYYLNRKRVEETFQNYIENKNAENEQIWLDAVSEYKDIACIILEKLMQENQDVLKRLKEI